MNCTVVEADKANFDTRRSYLTRMTGMHNFRVYSCLKSKVKLTYLHEKRWLDLIVDLI